MCFRKRNLKKIDVLQTQAATTAATYHGKKISVAIGKFANQSSYNNGIFSDNRSNRLTNQAQVILASHLQNTGRFNVLNRSNLDEMAAETQYANKRLNVKGAEYIVSGDIVEFGRKQVGDRQLFGILGRGKQQIAYAKVAIHLIDVTTSETVYVAQGAGEYQLSNHEIIGFGGTASYDTTLNGNVLDLAIREAIDNLIKEMH